MPREHPPTHITSRQRRAARRRLPGTASLPRRTDRHRPHDRPRQRTAGHHLQTRTIATPRPSQSLLPVGRANRQKPQRHAPGVIPFDLGRRPAGGGLGDICVAWINQNCKRRCIRSKRDPRRAIARPFLTTARCFSSRRNPPRSRRIGPVPEAGVPRSTGKAPRSDRKLANPDRKAQRLARDSRRLAIATLGALRASPKTRAPLYLPCGRPGEPCARSHSPCDRKPASLANRLKPLRAQLKGLRVALDTSRAEPPAWNRPPKVRRATHTYPLPAGFKSRSRP